MAYNLEEQESIDNLKGWWEKWGTPVLVVITLACVGVAGYNGWKWWNHRQTAKASVAYVALETAVNNQDGKNIKSISDGLIDQYGSTVYGPMAAFVAARYAADNGDIATAKQKLQWVVDHGDRKEFEAIARVRLAGLLMDEKSYDKAVSLLTGFTPATDTERLVIDDRLGDVYQAMGKNAEARYELCLAANWAGIAFADTDCHLGHNMADGISNAFHTPHGMNCVWVSPELMNACANVVPREVSVVGEALGVQFTGQETPEEIGAKTAEAIRSLMHSVGLKSPKEMGFDRDTFINCYKVAMEIDLGLRLNCPFEATPEIVKDLYTRIYDNYQ